VVHKVFVTDRIDFVSRGGRGSSLNCSVAGACREIEAGFAHFSINLYVLIDLDLTCTKSESINSERKQYIFVEFI